MAENKWIGWGLFHPERSEVMWGPPTYNKFYGPLCRWWVQSYGDVVCIFWGYIWPGTQNFYLYF